MIFVVSPALAAFLVLAALGCVAGLLSWTVRVRRSSPPFAWWISLVLLALDTSALVFGIVEGLVMVLTSPPGNAAQHVGHVSLAVSMAVYNAAFGLILAFLVALGLGFCRRRWGV